MYIYGMQTCIYTMPWYSDLLTLFQTETDELCGSAESLAQQLTHIELERLSYIGAEEFVQAFAIQTPLIDPTFKDPRITTNYEVYMEWSTRLKRLVVTDIVRVSIPGSIKVLDSRISNILNGSQKQWAVGVCHVGIVNYYSMSSRPFAFHTWNNIGKAYYICPCRWISVASW